MVDRDVTFDIYVSLAWLRSKGEVIPEYLLYFINSENAKQQFNRRLKGVGVPNLHLKEIRKVLIPFPNEIPEQQRIVTKLDELFAAIDRAIGLLEENIKHTQALMGSVLDEEFGKLEEFEILTIDEAKESNVIGLVRNVKTQDNNNDYDYLKMNNITKVGDLELNNMVRVNATKEEFEKFSLKKGDFLFNTRNSVELVGKTAVYDLDKSILYNNSTFASSITY